LRSKSINQSGGRERRRLTFWHGMASVGDRWHGSFLPGKSGAGGQHSIAIRLTRDRVIEGQESLANV